jgi:hypothetical protein
VYFPGAGGDDDGQAIVDWIEGATAGDDSTVIVLGFHRIDHNNGVSSGPGSSCCHPTDADCDYDTGTNPVDSNCYLQVDFEEILDGLEILRDADKIDVVPYYDAISKIKRHEPRWNYVPNRCLQHPEGSTTEASGWSDPPGTLQADTGSGIPDCRELAVTQGTSDKTALIQQIQDLTVGETYTAAVEVEWVNVTDEMDVWLRISNWHGVGQGDPDDDVPQNRGIILSEKYAGPGTTNDRYVIFMDFVAPASHVRFEVIGEGDSDDATQQWIFRRPVLFRRDVIGGNDSVGANAHKWPGLVTFRAEMNACDEEWYAYTTSDGTTPSSKGAHATECGGDGNIDGTSETVRQNIWVMNARDPVNSVFPPGSPQESIADDGPGPSHFLVTSVQLEANGGTCTGILDWRITGMDDGAGKVYCEQKGVTLDEDWPNEQSPGICYVEDNQSREECRDFGGTECYENTPARHGNQIHFEIDPVSGTFTDCEIYIIVEGIVIR